LVAGLLLVLIILLATLYLYFQHRKVLPVKQEQSQSNK
jgi:Tfp pilus assembly protein PilW